MEFFSVHSIDCLEIRRIEMSTIPNKPNIANIKKCYLRKKERQITDNIFLGLSIVFRKRLNTNLLLAFEKMRPLDVIDKYVKINMTKIREKVYPVAHPISHDISSL
jgi:hypothetical protein